MGTLIPLAPALTLDLTTIYGEVLLCWITQTGRGTPFGAAGALPSRSPPGPGAVSGAGDAARPCRRPAGLQHQAEAALGL